MTIMITVANTKGGSTKSTSTVNLAATGALLGKRVLMIDFDQQGSATSLCGLRELSDINIEDHSSWRMILEKTKPSELVVKSAYGFDVIPGSGRLYDAEAHIINTPHGDGILSKVFSLDEEFIKSNYDLVICDTQGAASRLQRSCLSMTQEYVIPDTATEDAREQLPLLLGVVKQLNDDLPLFHPKVELRGHFFSSFVKDETVSMVMDQICEKMFGEKHLKDFYIPHTTVFRQASLEAIPLVRYQTGLKSSKPAARAAEAYKKLFEALFPELF